MRQCRADRKSSSITTVHVAARPIRMGEAPSGTVVPLSVPDVIARWAAAGFWVETAPGRTPVLAREGAARLLARPSGRARRFLPLPRDVTRVPYRSERNTPMATSTIAHR